MPARRIIPDRLQETTTLSVLRRAVRVGFADLDEGRFVDVPTDGLEAFISTLGHEAARRLNEASR